MRHAASALRDTLRAHPCMRLVSSTRLLPYLGAGGLEVDLDVVWVVELLQHEGRLRNGSAEVRQAET